MAQAYVPIQTVTVGSGGAASIEFTNIPGTYTDLYFVLSTRGSASNSDEAQITFNDTTTNYSSRVLYGTGSSAASLTGGTSNITTQNNLSTETSSTFSSVSVYIPNYTSSNYKSLSIDALRENNATAAYQNLTAGLWSNTAAITKIKIALNNGNFVQYSTATLYGIGGTRASGGTITADARYTYHTFTSSGTFTANENIKGAEILCIAGGGGGGWNVGGGGGAGGLLYTQGKRLTAGTSYSAIVGSGGTGATSSVKGGSGTDSMFISVATGGGGGGTRTGSGTLPPLSGGSGGGGAGETYTQAGASGTSGQGNAGGTGNESSGTSYRFAAGGGGGAGAAGENGVPTTNAIAGAGGIGLNTYSSWANATGTGESGYYAGGGGGGAGYNNTQTSVSGAGGLGGGGRGGSRSQSLIAIAGTANTGGGGGGGDNDTYVNGKNGGSGLVIIRYPN